MAYQARVTIAEAARLTGLTQLEIGHLIQNRKLSLETGKDRKKTISHASLKGHNGYVPPEPPRDAPRPDPSPRPQAAEPEPEAPWEPSVAEMAALVRLDDRGRGEMIAAMKRQHPQAGAYFRNHPLPPVHKRQATPPPPPPPPPLAKPGPLFTSSPLKFMFTFSGQDLKSFISPDRTPTPPPPQKPVRPPAPISTLSPAPLTDRPSVYRVAFILGALGVGAYLTAPRRNAPYPVPPVVTPRPRPAPVVIHHTPRPKPHPPRILLPHSPVPPPSAVQPAPGPPIRWYPGVLPPLRNPDQTNGRP